MSHERRLDANHPLLYDHTDSGGSTYSYLLNGGYDSQVGLAKSFKVYPGDKVRIEAYAKYFTVENPGNSNLSGFATALLSAFALGAPGGGEAGTASAGVNSWGGVVAGGGGKTNTTYPKAFVNLLVFDKKFNFLDLGFDGINGGQQVGVSPDVAHDPMATEYTATEEGYIYVYISNESATLVDVYFDDIKVTYTPGRVIQGNEYYPFGLQTATSWTRENNLGNNFLYNGGTELNKTTQVYDLYYRNYDPVLGRFGQIDPMASKYGPVSPYHFAGNNPVVFNDPMGDEFSNDDFVRWYNNPPLLGPHDTNDPNRVYRGSDPYGGLTAQRFYAQHLEWLAMHPTDYQKSEEMKADARWVQMGRMSHSQFGVRYGTQMTDGEAKNAIASYNWSVLASRKDLIVALARYIGGFRLYLESGISNEVIARNISQGKRPFSIVDGIHKINGRVTIYVKYSTEVGTGFAAVLLPSGAGVDIYEYNGNTGNTAFLSRLPKVSGNLDRFESTSGIRIPGWLARVFAHDEFVEAFGARAESFWNLYSLGRGQLYLTGFSSTVYNGTAYGITIYRFTASYPIFLGQNVTPLLIDLVYDVYQHNPN